MGENTHGRGLLAAAVQEICANHSQRIPYSACATDLFIRIGKMHILVVAMRPIKQIVAAITALAVLASSVAAARCCCLRPAEPVRKCCIAPAQVSTLHACCQKKQSVRTTSPVRTSCCCAPTTPSASFPVHASVTKNLTWSYPVGQALDGSCLTSAVSRLFQQPPDRISVSGPALLALHCTWLN